MSSHKGPLVAQGNGAPAGNRAAGTVELVELGALVEKKGTWAISSPTKAEEEQAYPGPQEEGEEEKEEFVCEVWEECWRVIPYHVLPDWLKDSNYPLRGHWPPVPSFWACFKSIFCIYMETGDIWILLPGFPRLIYIHRLCSGQLCLLRGTVGPVHPS
uniref:Adiponectin receptor 1 n=1 Tax=Moschus moschiferus TaxID=68415 RepID=A0A8C6FN06_MOSMO